MTARESGERYSFFSASGRSRPPNAFLCNSQPKICTSVNFFCLEIGRPALGASGLCPPHSYATDSGRCVSVEVELEDVEEIMRKTDMRCYIA